jgi:hypothetical protein
MFGTVVDKMGGLLSRSFILANFFPFLIFAAAGVALAWTALPETRPALKALFEMDPGKQAMVLATVLIMIAVIAYVVSPLTVVVRQILEGQFIPQGMQDSMRSEQQGIADDLKKQRDKANKRDDQVLEIFRKRLDDLAAARNTGDDLHKLAPNAKNQIDTAWQRLDSAEKLAIPGHAAEENTIEALQKAIDSTVEALRVNSTKLPDPASIADRDLAEKLADAQTRVTALLRKVFNPDRVKQPLSELAAARSAGDGLDALGADAEAQIDTALQRLQQAQNLLIPGHAADDAAIAALESAVDATVAALRDNSTALPATASDQDRELAAKLADAQVRAAALLRNAFDPDMVDRQLSDLAAARSTGDALGKLGADAEAQIDTALEQLEQMEKLVAAGHAADDATIVALKSAVDATVAALRANSATLPAAASEEDRELAARLADAQTKATTLLRRAVDDARQGLVNSQEALRGRFARKGIWPTRIANIRAAAESHGLDAYDIEFDFLWPRLRLAIQKDEKTAALIEAAKVQVDFSLLMVLLCGLFTAGWLIVLAFFGGSPLAVILLGLAGLWITFFFLRVVEESVKQLGELAGATIDFYRFKLLREMDIGLPGNLVAERDLWHRLQQSSAGLGTVDIAYRHGTP